MEVVSSVIELKKSAKLEKYDGMNERRERIYSLSDSVRGLRVERFLPGQLCSVATVKWCTSKGYTYRIYIAQKATERERGKDKQTDRE